MTVRKTIAAILDIDPGRAVAGRARSPRWHKVQAAHLRRHPTCAVCGSKKTLNVHHVLPYHLYPRLELDRRNLLTLCRDHHLLFGHLGDFKGFNPLIRADAEIWHFRLRSAKYLLRLARAEHRRTVSRKGAKARRS